MTRGRATIGVDIGGTKTLLALFDEKFRLLDHIKERTPAREKFEEFLLSSAAKLARRAEREARELVGVGVGCAGTVDLRGELTASPNVPFLAGYPLRSKLAKAAGAGVTLGNDAQLGLYGEHRLGAAVGLRHVIGAFLGTGVGGALIVDGELYRGAGGAAGELGHFLVSPLGRLAGSERKATLDDLVSRPGIAGEAAAIASRREAPGLERLAGADVKRIHSGTLAKSVRRGDKRVEEMLRGRARMAGIALASLVDFLNPEMVVLGGGLVEAMPALFSREIEAGIREHAVAPAGRTVRVAVAKLKDFAVAAGAAKMAWDASARGSRPD